MEYEHGSLLLVEFLRTKEVRDRAMDHLPGEKGDSELFLVLKDKPEGWGRTTQLQTNGRVERIFASQILAY